MPLNWTKNPMRGSESSGCRLWFILIVGAILIVQQGNGLSQEEKDQINTGLEAGKEIAGFIASKEFAKTMTKIGSSGGAYLEALDPFIEFVSAFLPSESAELSIMKEIMETIDSRFDVMDSQFNDVERLIDWSAVQFNFGQIEQKILALADEYEIIYRVPAGAVENRKTLFLAYYNSEYENSGTKLYEAVMLSQGTFQENLGDSVMRYTENDRTKTQAFLLGISQLLLQAVKIELAYLRINDNHMQTQWKTRIQAVKNEFERVDRDVMDKYHDQSGLEIVAFAAANRGLSSRDFAQGLFDLLKGKYYWREWVVLAYNDISGRDKHKVSTCEGHVRFSQNGRNIVVGSKVRSSTVMNKNRAGRKMRNVVVETPMVVTYPSFTMRYIVRKAYEVYDSLTINDACLVAVIKSNSGLHYASHTRRLKFESRSPYFDLIAWG